MKNYLALMAIFSCLSAFAHDQQEEDYEYDHRGREGAYLEFDTEGTHGDQVRREIVHGTYKVATAPFRAVCICAKKTKKGLAYAHDQVETFASPAASMSGRSRDIRDNFEVCQDPEGYIIERDRNAGHNFCFGLPSAIWKLSKSTAATIFIRLPRGTWRTVKSFGRGTCDCAGM